MARSRYMSRLDFADICVHMSGVSTTSTNNQKEFITPDHLRTALTITTGQAARMLGVPETLIVDEIDRGALRAIYIAGQCLIATESLRDLVAPPRLDAAAVAARIGCSPQKVYAMWQRGELPCVRAGRSRYMTSEQFTEWEQAGGAPSAVPSFRAEQAEWERRVDERRAQERMNRAA